MRVFGNELRYMNIQGNGGTEQQGINFLDILIKLAKNQDYTFTQSFMFLDSSMIIPTMSGFPMNLTVNGSATVDLKASGKMDLRKLGSKPRSLSVNGYVQPRCVCNVYNYYPAINRRFLCP